MAKNWQHLVETAPTRTYQRKTKRKTNLLARYVPKKVFDGGTPPTYLHASGNLNRCNPEGVECIYFAEGPETARAEFDSYYKNPLAELGYYARVGLRAILDFEDPATFSHFGILSNDFSRSFAPKSGALIPLQSVGLAVSRQRRITAIRYPSNAMRKLGKSGINIVLFHNLITAPDFLEIMEHNRVLERWPASQPSSKNLRQETPNRPRPRNIRSA